MTDTTHQKENIIFENTVDTSEELAKFIIATKYARYVPELNRREVWEESVDRNLSMHLKKFSHLDDSLIAKIKWAFDLVKAKRVMPSMRTMQYAGEAIEVNNARGYNCSVRHVDCPRAFAEIFFLLLSGCGVGIGLYNKYLSRLPRLIKAEEKTGTVLLYTVEDTIEGWADALGILMNSYMHGNEVSGRKIVFDFSKIRPEGSQLKIGGGKAPGYKPLKHALIKIRTILEDAVENRHETRLKSIDAYDILMHASDAVLSGGVRRSATIVLFDKDDEDMLTAKVGNWFEENPQRARSNNSVLIIRDDVDKKEFLEIFNRTKEWGEPGFLFADNPDVLTNPCGEIGFIPITENGNGAVQFCNLTSVNGAKVDTLEDWLEAVEAATIIGTLQATYTDFHYLSKEAKEITEQEALLGVSATAWYHNPQVMMNPINQKLIAEHAVNINKEWANALGINQAARVTAIKPEGSGSLAYGTMLSGIHGAHSRLMFRRVQMNKKDPVYRLFKMMNPEHCEESIYSVNRTDDVVTFPIIVPDSAILKDELDAITHLEDIRMTFENYILPGKTEANKKDVDHNVSCTVLVDDEEWIDVAEYLYENRYKFAAVSFLPRTGDKHYAQAPNEAVVSEEDLNKFSYLLKNFFPIDYTLMHEESDQTTLSGELACTGPQGCEIT